MRKNHSKIVCIKLVHLPYLHLFISSPFLVKCLKRKLQHLGQVAIIPALNVLRKNKLGL